MPPSEPVTRPAILVSARPPTTTSTKSITAASMRRLSSCGPAWAIGVWANAFIPASSAGTGLFLKPGKGDHAPPVERFAVIDMGSNSWRLVVYGYEPGTPWWSLTDEIREAVRVGAGMGEDQTLKPEPMDRALHTA